MYSKVCTANAIPYIYSQRSFYCMSWWTLEKACSLPWFADASTPFPVTSPSLPVRFLYILGSASPIFAAVEPALQRPLNTDATTNTHDTTCRHNASKEDSQPTHPDLEPVPRNQDRHFHLTLAGKVKVTSWMVSEVDQSGSDKRIQSKLYRSYLNSLIPDTLRTSWELNGFGKIGKICCLIRLQVERGFKWWYHLVPSQRVVRFDLGSPGMRICCCCYMMV